MFKLRQTPETKISCTHCGDACEDDHIVHDGKDFCCNGCKVVYSVLSENGLGDYYVYGTAPGASQRSGKDRDYSFLEDAEVVSHLLEFAEDHICRITFTLPQIHCASCIWLLENIGKLNPGILGSRVNFLSRSATITYNPAMVSLRQVVEQLALIGYPPELNLQKLNEAKNVLRDRTLIYKLGVAGFAFGNIMLLSFPEYLGFRQASVKFYLGYINIGLSLPVLLYSGYDYLRSAYWTLKFRKINIDIPIAVGMLTLFFRSVYEILSATGEGYLDSLAGFVFFLLIGRWFQQYTFDSIAFDRNYRSYFPISAMVRSGNEWISRTLDKLEAGDVILVRNEEIIPGDGLVVKGDAAVDYSFVTGESEVIRKREGEKVFSGGKNTGAAVQIMLSKKVDQSYLTRLWDEDTFRIDKESGTQTIIDRVGKYFTMTIMTVAVITLFYWLSVDKSMAFNAFTAVLIVACPCALALALPFSYGNLLRLLGKRSFYLKNVKVIDRIQQTDMIIFDKTGTITDHRNMKVTNPDHNLDDRQTDLLRSTVFLSGHPASKAIFSSLGPGTLRDPDTFHEYPGSGIEASFGQEVLRVGSEAFVNNMPETRSKPGVFVSCNGQVVARFDIEHRLREGVDTLVNTLGRKYDVIILSGDNDREEQRLKAFFPAHAKMIFHQTPADKLNFVKDRQLEGHRVVMIGDGLNDAGALMQSDVGIVISEDNNNFTPACDAILGASEFPSFLSFLNLIIRAKWIVSGAFLLSVMYNLTGLVFAVNGKLTPVVAAILMPMSSITVMVYGLVASTLAFGYFTGKKSGDL